jgi:mannose-1-phosphate guanylyltransferase
VQSFQEKPDELTAARYTASGEYYWNCGIFVWRAQTILDALAVHAPQIHERLMRLRPFVGTAAWPGALAEQFPEMPSISIDYAVLEKASDVLVLEAPFDWDDVGSWHSLARLNPVNSGGNLLQGLACPVDSTGCIVRTSSDHMIATIGVKDLIIVHTPTATLVADKRDEGAIRELIKELERRGLQDYL